jgi:hypothetical protein
MILSQVETWPKVLLDYLASKSQMLLDHEVYERESSDAYMTEKERTGLLPWRHPSQYSQDRETVLGEVLGLLQSTTLHGWHCTRLTDYEAEHIKAHGMQPPNRHILTERIRRVQADGMLEDHVAKRLIEENQGDQKGREGMIWFCFYEPRIAGQREIERFFRRWGGEALYNSHERDPITGEALRKIGRPCLIEADVPISLFGRITYLGEKVIRRYLFSKGFGTREELEHDDKARGPIPASNILRLVFLGEPAFAALTGCDSWDPPLVCVEEDPKPS